MIGGSSGCGLYVPGAACSGKVEAYGILIFNEDTCTCS